MRWDEISHVPCSVSRALSVVGDRWTLHIIRDCFYGTMRFDDFQKQIGMTRHILSDRLKKLVDNGLLKQSPYQDNPVRYDYTLTEKGRDLFPVLMTLAQWGDKWMSDQHGAPVDYVHDCCSHTIKAHLICEDCGEEIRPDEVTPQRGIGFPVSVKPTRYARYSTRLRSRYQQGLD